MVAYKVDVQFDPELYTLCPVPGLRLVTDCRFPGVYLWGMECRGEGIAYAGQFLPYYVGQGVGQRGIGARVWQEVHDWDKELAKRPLDRGYFTPLDWTKYQAGIRVKLDLPDEKFDQYILCQNEVLRPMYRVLAARIDDPGIAKKVENEIVYRLRSKGGRALDFLWKHQKKGGYGHQPDIGKITAGGRKIIGLTADVPPGLQ
jgi:hypothetical protein